MIALVLVGGEGTRLRPLTYDVPKPMLPVLERPMIARVVEWLARHGVDRVVFSLGYRPDAFVEAFPGGHWSGVELAYAVEPERLDTAGAIRFAAHAVGVAHERLIVVNGDILTDLDLGALLEFHTGHGGDATIALTPVEDPSSYGVVPIDRSGRVLEFIEKPPHGEAPTNEVNAGTYILEPAVLARIAPGGPISIERTIFPELVADGLLYASASDAYWLDTGTPQRYIQAQLDVLRGLRPDVELPECTEPSSGARLAPGAHLAGVCLGEVFIGANASVGPGAVLEDAVLSAGATVAAGARITNSLVLSGAVIGRDAVIEDSIVGPRARIGDEAVLRAATVIGAGAVVAPGEYLDSARLPV